MGKTFGLTPAFWITLAGALFTLGYLLLNQVTLMLDSFASYATLADRPLWGRSMAAS